jgi:hypothetical protein
MNIWRGGIVVIRKLFLSTVVSVGKELSELGSGSYIGQGKRKKSGHPFKAYFQASVKPAGSLKNR